MMSAARTFLLGLAMASLLHPEPGPDLGAAESGHETEPPRHSGRESKATETTGEPAQHDKGEAPRKAVKESVSGENVESGRPAEEGNPARPGVDALESSNLLKPSRTRSRVATPAKDYRRLLDTARQLRRSQNYAGASHMLAGILEEEPPVEIQKAALFELALVAQDQKQLPRAQQILAQYLTMFPQDPTVPEVLLRQGLVFRQMGAQQLALAKYYAVMNSALNLKLDQFDYYRRLVLQAQTEIADTYYLQGKFKEAADFFQRILKQSSTELNTAYIHFKLIRCLASLGRHPEVVTQAEQFFLKYPESPDVPELRFLSASSLRETGRASEAMTQVLKLLEAQEAAASKNPENWVYWQQRAGNEIANQLYLEGDYLNALQIYQHLTSLDTSLAWQLPVRYQTGLIYERLRQPGKAAEVYTNIISKEKELMGAEDTSTLRTVIEMAKWRKDHLAWQGRTEVAVQSLHLAPPPPVDRKKAVPTRPRRESK